MAPISPHSPLKVALLAPYPPYPPMSGGQQRMFQLLRCLATSCEIHLLYFRPNDQSTDETEFLLQYCASVTVVSAPLRSRWQRLGTTVASYQPDMIWRGFSRQFRTVVEQFIFDHKPDIIQCESIEMTQYAPKRRGDGTPVWLYDAFNVEYTIQKRAAMTDMRSAKTWPKAIYSFIQWAKLWHYERQLGQRFQGSFVVSPGDSRLLRSLNPELPITIVPNGVDTSFFVPVEPLAVQPICLFTGTLNYRANIDAIRWFSEAVWPKILHRVPEAKFYIAGRNPTSEVLALSKQPGIHLFSNVPDIRPLFNEAALYIVPMRIGGGMRLKVLEAFSQGVPVVSTGLGVDGVEGIINNTHAFVRDGPKAFSDAVVELFLDRNRSSELASAARAFVLERYEWSTIFPAMERVWSTWFT
ncbi:MAG: glycosyltransferase [Herpetosiphon sp.]